MMDTIFALATARGRAGVAVVRISGPEAGRAGLELMADVPERRGVRILKDGAGLVLDEVLVLHFPKGQSFTGEMVLELHLHGSPAVIAAVMGCLEQIAFLRPAEAGEFTKHALENGRLDLAQVEGLADLIDAETESQRRQAMRVFGGALGDLAEAWRADLIRAAALVEATIDFVDEDVPVDVYPEVVSLLEATASDMTRQAEGVAAAEIIRDGFEVAIVGEPNVGKSTLLNRIAGREAAITSEVAGTTRDVIEVRIDVAGYAVTFLDTAGIRDTEDQIEGIGIARARARAADADLRVFLVEEQELPPFAPKPGDLVFVSKKDDADGTVHEVSGRTGAGLDRLIAEIRAVLDERTQRAGVAMRARHRAAMLSGVQGIAAAESLIQDSGPADLIAQEIREAISAVDSIVGRVDVEDLLSEIFSSFCIGK